MKLDRARIDRAAATAAAAAIAVAAAVTVAVVVVATAADGVTKIAANGAPAATTANQGGRRSASCQIAMGLAGESRLKNQKGKDDLAPAASDSIFAFFLWSKP